MFSVRSIRPCALLCALSVLLVTPAYGRLVRLRVLHTSNLRGHVFSGKRAGGVLRLSTLIARARAESPHLLLLDTGNQLMGTAAADVTGGQLSSAALETLSYNAFVPGTTDLAMGLHEWTRSMGYARGHLLAANIRGKGIRSYEIHEMDGLRIAVIGLTTAAPEDYVLPAQLDGYQIINCMAAIEDALRQIRQHEPAVIILVASQAMRNRGDDPSNRIHEIAKRFPELDVIIGGGPSGAISEADLNGVLYTHAGSFAKELGSLMITYDTVRGDVVSKRGSLITADTRTPEEDSLREILERKFGEDLVKLDDKISSWPGEGTSTSGEVGWKDLIGCAMRDVYSTDVAIHSYRTPKLKPVPVLRERDLHTIIPVNAQVGVCRLNSGELRRILQEGVYDAPAYDAITVTGVECEKDAAGDGVAISKVNGKNPHPRKRFSVAIDSALLASRGGKNKELGLIVAQPTSRLSIKKRTVREAVRSYLRKTW